LHILWKRTIAAITEAIRTSRGMKKVSSRAQKTAARGGEKVKAREERKTVKAATAPAKKKAAGAVKAAARVAVLREDHLRASAISSF
jgi:hypothetical protein